MGWLSGGALRASAASGTQAKLRQTFSLAFPEFAGKITLARTVHVRMLSASYLPSHEHAASTDAHTLGGPILLK